MTTGEFIKMLQKEDPSGKLHIRMPGGVPYFAESKEGYWDGPYFYIDEEGNMVYSSLDGKVDVHCLDVSGFVEQNFSLNFPGRNTWEDIRKKFKFKLGNYAVKEHQIQRQEQILTEAKEAFDMIYEIHKDSYDNSLKEMIQNAEKGWTWFQDKKIDSGDPKMHKFYTWKVYDGTGKEQGSNVHYTESIQISGLWDKQDNGKKLGYYQWIFKN